MFNISKVMIEIPEQKEYIANEKQFIPDNLLLRHPSVNSSASSFNTPIGGGFNTPSTSFIQTYTPYHNTNNSISITTSITSSNTPKIRDDNVIAKIDLNDDPFGICDINNIINNNHNNTKHNKNSCSHNNILYRHIKKKNITINNHNTNHTSKKTKSNLEYHEKYSLKKRGYKIKKVIAHTLQGKVIQAIRKHDNKIVVIKITNIKLHKQGITIKNGKKIKVKENILKEKDIMLTIQKRRPPKGFIDIVDFFDDGKNYFLVMEDGGSDFFDNIVEMHDKIKKGTLSLKEWKKHVKILFAQMCTFVKFLHNIKCCHLDISLENMLIKNVIFNEATGKFISHGTVNFCDFGLAEFFKNNTTKLNLKNPFVCRKYVGKTTYKAPKVYAKRHSFDARKADVWSLSICLFMMNVGAPPYQKPSFKDATFEYIWDGNLKALLKEWKREKYVSGSCIDLFNHILIREEKRYFIQDIMSHKYIKTALVHTKKFQKKRLSLNDENVYDWDVNNKKDNYNIIKKNKKTRSESEPVKYEISKVNNITKKQTKTSLFKKMLSKIIKNQ